MGEIVQDEGRPLNIEPRKGSIPGSIFKVMMAAAALETRPLHRQHPSTAMEGISSVVACIMTGKPGAWFGGSPARPRAIVRRLFLHGWAADGDRDDGLLCPSVWVGEETGIDCRLNGWDRASEAWKRKAKNEACCQAKRSRHQLDKAM